LRIFGAFVLAAVLLVMVPPNVVAARAQSSACALDPQVTLNNQPAAPFSWTAPTLLSPQDGATIPADPCFCWNNVFTLRWEQHSDACSYDIQIACDRDFTQVVLEQTEYRPPHEESPSRLVTDGSLGAGSCGSTFYWRVRAVNPEPTSPSYSYWSEIRSFTIEPGPAASIHLTAPYNGVTNVPVTDVSFTWSSVPQATSYNFTLSANADLSSPIVAETGLTTTAYTYSGTLEYQTPYYWQVSALKAGNIYFTSSTVTFSTRPAPSPAPETQQTQLWVWLVIAIAAVVAVMVAVLLFRTRRA
jgi:hypothetical protein